MPTRLITALLVLAAPAAALPQGSPIEPLRWEVPYSYPDFIGTPWSVAKKSPSPPKIIDLRLPARSMS